MRKQKIAASDPHVVKIKGVEYLTLNIICNSCKKPIIGANHVCGVASEIQEKQLQNTKHTKY